MRTLALLFLLLSAGPLGAADAAAWRGHAARLLKAGQPDRAEAAYVQALRLDSRDPLAWAGLGHARWRQGKREAALQAWRGSLRLRPDNRALADFVRSTEGAALPARPAVRAPEPPPAVSKDEKRWWRRGLLGGFVGVGLAIVALF